MSRRPHLGARAFAALLVAGSATASAACGASSRTSGHATARASTDGAVPPSSSVAASAPPSAASAAPEAAPPSDARAAPASDVEAAARIAEAQARIAEAQARIAEARDAQARALEAQAAQQRAERGDVQAASTALADAALHGELARLAQRVGEADAALAQIASLRAGSVDAPDPHAPPICADGRALESLRLAPASAPLTVGDVTRLARQIDDLCARLRRWREPDERSAPAIAEYALRLARVEGWMREVRGCVGATGRDAARCENAYGRTADAEAREARAIEALLAAHRRELDGVEAGQRPFPCATPTLARIASTRFEGPVARAQLPAFPRAAESVCAAIGVDAPGLRALRRGIALQLDSLESGARTERARWLREAELLRARLGT